MKLCQEIEKYAAFVGVRKMRPDEKTKYNPQNIVVLLVFVLLSISSTCVIAFDDETIQDYSESIFAWISIVFILIGFLTHVEKMIDIFDLKSRAEQTVEIQSIDPMVKHLHEDTNAKINKWTIIVHTFLIKLFIPLAAVLSVVFAYYIYFTTDSGNGAFIVPKYIRFPFDPATPVGFAGAVVILMTSFFLICHVAVCGIGLFIGFFGVAMSGSQSVLNKFFLLNENFKIDQNATEIRKQFRDTIKCHSEVKELVISFTILMKFTISLYYIWSILAICDTLLMCQAAEDAKDFILPITTAFWSFVQIFLLCEVGERLTGKFVAIDTEIFYSDWYTFPIDVQKTLVILINGTQIPVFLNGVGNILCTREAFKNVTTKGYSYFTTLRQI